METAHDTRALALVADACLAVDRLAWDGERALGHLEWLRGELLAELGACGEHAAAGVLLAVEAIDAALRGEPVRTALAS